MIERRFPPHLTYHVLPFLLAIMFVVIAVLPAGNPTAGILSFALAGFGCSALLPLTISFGEEQLVTMSAAAAGAIIAFYQAGYGLAAFGAGPLQAAGLSLPTLFAIAAGVALAMGMCSFLVTSRRPVATPSSESSTTEGAIP
jgi:predicted MFS family arabinose efflux permease